jgi:hypothetical protein
VKEAAQRLDDRIASLARQAASTERRPPAEDT